MPESDINRVAANGKETSVTTVDTLHDTSRSRQTEDSRTASLVRAMHQWLASAACQSDGGAFYAWLEAGTGIPAFEYPEITGYALTHFAGRDNLTIEEERAGRRAADWLVARLSADLSARRQWDNASVYNFDLAMIATGLLAFGDRAGVDVYVNHGKVLVDLLRRQIHSETGFTSLSPEQSALSNRSAWSTEGHAHLLKVVQCLLLAETLGVTNASESARLLVEQSTRYQRDDGRFVTHPGDVETMLHPHLYAVEGLWMWGTAQGDATAIERARTAHAWMWSHQLPTGGFPRFVNTGETGDAPIEQADVTSQALRMALALDPSLPGIPAAIARLEQIAQHTPDGAALVYQPAAPQAHLNAWVTLFGAQAMEMAAFGSSMLTWRKLV